MPAVTKRKRDQLDHGAGARPAPHHAGADFVPYMEHHGDGDMELAEALTKHNKSGEVPGGPPGLNAGDGSGHSVSDTANAALHFPMPTAPASESNFLVHEDSADHSEPAPEPSFDLGSPNPRATSGSAAPDSEFNVDHIKDTGPPHEPAPPVQSPHPPKANPGPQAATGAAPHSPSASPADDENAGSPANRHKVGSEEWAASRRLAHKEVERRRREAINDGISELGKIVPGAERNKGSILHRAVLYINELKERQTQTEQKNNLEKMVFEQAIAEVTGSADKLKADVRRLESELERWRSAARASGVALDDR
ncbi:hypothetical protein K461DRAFT_275237 [Myriangium duriaei CBS 260.36]|uniref:BHLH domain-containing protein n=1 Tax=Myriangium duriaei CBS 260.36 TaxID=1168546 RepID=A0A9P4JC49_9PEZI|nr:hypothetical protein K461DRAFT_275237 [Myriangium duriaei CBS 260.36]